jgi:CRISPR-associated protein Csm2
MGGRRNRGGGRPERERGGGAIQETVAHVGRLDSLGNWSAADLVAQADDVGRELGNGGVTTSQIRNFLDEVNRIEAESRVSRDTFDESRVIFLKVQLAYAAGRENKLKSFAGLFSTAVDKVHSREDFDRFVKFTQAVVAYHRYYGGSNQ